MHKYTEEQVGFLLENIKGRSYQELVNLFNDYFGVKLKLSQIKNFIGNRKLNSGLDGRFKKGNVPANKGKRGGGWEPTQFKKGNVPHNYKPVGSEKICDGYVWVKIADPKKVESKTYYNLGE